MTADIDTLMTQTSGDVSHDDTTCYKEPLNVNQYKFMDDAYYGENGFRDGTYLTPHQREMFYTARRQTSVYKNFVRPIFDAMVTPIFSDAIPRNIDENSLFASFLEDTDNNGTPLDAAIQEAISVAVRHGQSFIIMDNFPAVDQPETVMQARQDRVFPYIMVKTALDVETYELDRWGNIVTITFIDRKVTINKKETQLYRTWTKTSSVLVEKVGDGKYKPVEEPVEHNLEVLPVIPIYLSPRRDKTKLCVNPPLYDLARISLVIYNKDSEVRDLERSQSFSVLCVQSDRGGNISLGSRNVLFVPMDTTITPSFISPNPSILVGLMVNAEKLREDLYKLAEQNGVTAVKSEASGVSESYRFFGHESVLQKISALAGKLDQAIFDLFCLYTGETPEYSTDYPTDFAPGNITVEVETLEKYLGQNPPPKAKSLALQKWTRLILADQDPEELQEALDEIAAEAEEPEEEPMAPPPPFEGSTEEPMEEDPEEVVEAVE